MLAARDPIPLPIIENKHLPLLRAWEELDRIARQHRSQSWKDESDLVYVKAFVKEVFRWRWMSSKCIETWRMLLIGERPVELSDICPRRYEEPWHFADKRTSHHVRVCFCNLPVLCCTLHASLRVSSQWKRRLRTCHVSPVGD